MAATVTSGEKGAPDLPGALSADSLPDARAQIAGLIFAVVLIDESGRIVEVNHAAESLLGTSASRIIGASLAERIGRSTSASKSACANRMRHWLRVTSRSTQAIARSAST